MWRFKIYIYIILFLALPFIGIAHSDQKEDIKRAFSKTKYENLSKKKEYQAFLSYKTAKNKDESFIKRIFLGMLQKLFGNKVSKFIFSALPYFLIILAVVLIVLRLTNIEMSKLLRPNSKRKLRDGFFEEENIHEINIEKLLQNALKDGDFRMAVRYNYMKILKKLSDTNKIHWEVYKTNYEYQFEVRKERCYTQFCDLTRYFEYIWYGEFSKDEENYYNKSVSLTSEMLKNLAR